MTLDPFNQALSVLRDDINRGAFMPGEPIKIAELARRLNLSATPVREALSRLAGHGLIEDRRGRGYFIWRIDGVDLADLYELQRIYLEAALRQPTRQSEAHRASSATGAAVIPDLLLEIMLTSGNLALIGAFRLIRERLALAILVEAEVLGPEEEDGEMIAALLREHCFEQLIVALKAYHRRRVLHATSIASAMRNHAFKNTISI